MEKKRFISLWMTLFYYLRYEINLILGKAHTATYLSMDEKYMKLYRRLQEAFESYDPRDRDFIGSLFSRKKIVLPHNLSRRSALWATDVLLIIDLMHNGKIPPDSFMPLIEPWQIDYYYERAQTYVNWLFDTDQKVQRRPVGFFHMIATERMFKLIREDNIRVKIAPVIPVISRDKVIMPQQSPFNEVPRKKPAPRRSRPRLRLSTVLP